MSPTPEALDRRTFLGVSAAVGGSMILAGCGGSGPDSAGGGSAKSLTLADWQNNNSAVPDALKQYSSGNGVRVTFQAPVDFDDYQTRFRTLLAGKTPPDILRIDDDDVVQFAAEGALADLNPYIKSTNFDASAMTKPLYNYPVTAQGHSAWVVGVQPRVMYYNKSLFKKAGVAMPPGTWTDTKWKWADCLAAAQKITDPSNGTWGVMILNDTGFYQTWSYNNNGTGIYSKDGKSFTLANPAGIEAMQWLADLTLKEKVQPSLAVVQQTNSAQSLFTQGKLGMYLSTFGDVPYLRQNAKNLDWDVAPVPGQIYQKVEGSLIVYAMPAKSEKKEAAFKALAYLAGPKGSRTIAKDVAFIPVNSSAAKLIKPSAHEDPAHLGLFVEAAAKQQSVSHTPGTATATAIYRPLMDQVWTGEKTAQEVLTGVRSQVEAAVQRQ